MSLKDEDLTYVHSERLFRQEEDAQEWAEAWELTTAGAGISFDSTGNSDIMGYVKVKGDAIAIGGGSTVTNFCDIAVGGYRVASSTIRFSSTIGTNGMDIEPVASPVGAYLKGDSTRATLVMSDGLWPGVNNTSGLGDGSNGQYWNQIACNFTVSKEQSSDVSTSEVSDMAAMAVYMKNDKFVIMYNNAGTPTYITIPMDGATTTWTHSTTAP